ncbi:MAG: bacteriohemerythrin [Phycisphaerae bacterium]|jgi:hemerythrin-like metal-binding protein|nr:bacteriohemerythrin [Phycisphaerae bacterium]
MAFAEWTDEYSVNVTEIDDQHKALFAMIDGYYEALSRQERTEALAELLEGLAQYAATHFSNEEAYFDQFGYEHAEAHKKAHADLVTRVTDIASRARQGVAVLNMELATFLRDWLNEHIKGLDTKYSQCFNDNGLT